MPAQFSLPPDTRTVGSGSPAADMDGVVDTLTAMGAGFNVLNAAYAGGADPSGVNDSTAAVNAAISALPGSGGTIYFPPGVYSCPGMIIVDKSYVTLQGAGYGFATQITVPAGVISRTAAIIIGNTAPVNQCTVRDLAVVVDGGTHAVNPGTGHGIVIAGNNCLVENVIVRWCSGDAFHFGDDLLNPAVQTTVAPASSGQALPSGAISVASTTGFASSGQLITRKTSGACAIVTYAGTSGGNTFTGCAAENFGGTTYTLNTGDVVIPVTVLNYDLAVINTYAMNYGGNGYYADWTYYSCEWLAAHADGASAKPAATASPAQNGFLVYGGTQKFVNCHGYFNAGNGMQIGDKNVFTAQDTVVVAGEWESNSNAGIYVTNNAGTVVIGGGANFYGQGLSGGSGADLLLGFGSVNVRVDNCVFRQSSLSLNQQNIYAFSAAYCAISNCVFYATSWSAKNIYLDGPTGAVSEFQVYGNRMVNANSAAVAVYLKGAVTNCSVHGNITDSAIQEIVSGSTPSGNAFWDNTFIAGHSGALTTAGLNVPAAITGTWQPADVGLIAWSFDPIDAPSATSAVNGTIYMVRLILRQSQVITNGGFFIAQAAVTATASQNYMALADSGGVIRASTAATAIDTATQSAGWLSAAFSSPYIAPAGTYYLAVLLNAATPLKFGSKTLQGSGGTEAGVGTASAFRYAVNGISATALPGSFALGSNAHSNGNGNAILFAAGVS